MVEPYFSRVKIKFTNLLIQMESIVLAVFKLLKAL